MMNALSLSLAVIVFFWWPFGTFVFERLTQGRQVIDASTHSMPVAFRNLLGGKA
jgi:hypothetical protein